MKIYRTETRKDYDALMYELESKGVKWYSGKQPHEFDGFEEYESETVISVTNELIEYFCMDFYKENYNEVEIIEYKAKKEFKELNESKFNEKKEGTLPGTLMFYKHISCTVCCISTACRCTAQAFLLTASLPYRI